MIREGKTIVLIIIYQYETSLYFSLFIKSGAACQQARSLWRIECFKIKYELMRCLKI